MVVFISGELLFFLLVLLIAGVSWIIDNLLWIILIAVIVNIVIPLIMYKCPELLFGAIALLLVIGIIALICMGIGKKVETNNTIVTIYKATADCIIYDESGDVITIPEGAIVARFRHPEQQSKEKNFVGNSSMCYWYTGSVHNTTVSIRRDILGSSSNMAPNQWNLEEIGQITYKQFLEERWWESGSGDGEK